LTKSQLELAARNLPQLKILLSTNLNVKDLLEADSVIVTKAAVAEITERLSK
jgi:ribosomal protein L4